MNNKTKVVLIIIGIVLLLFIAGSLGEKDNELTKLSSNPQEIIANAQEESSIAATKPQKEFEQISVADYLNFYQGGEEKLILLARPTCGYCQIAEPIIASIAYDYDIDIYYLNPDNFSDDDQVAFVNSNEEFITGYGTPLLFIVKDSKIIDEVDGLTDKAHYLNFFKTHNFIKG